MRYVRSFEVSAAHFNGQAEYDAWARGDYKTACEGTHGHNFKITVEAEARVEGAFPIVIGDEHLAEIVNAWQHQNLSVHRDFLIHHKRATTEEIARVLREKIMRDYPILVQVTVEETEDQIAIAGPGA